VEISEVQTLIIIPRVKLYLLCLSLALKIKSTLDYAAVKAKQE